MKNILRNEEIIKNTRNKRITRKEEKKNKEEKKKEKKERMKKERKRKFYGEKYKNIPSDIREKMMK